jgi:hypothetical protein
MLELNSHIYYIIGLHINELKSFYNYIISIKHIYNKQKLIRIKKDDFKPLKAYKLYKKSIIMSHANERNDADISTLIARNMYDFIVIEILTEDYDDIDKKNIYTLKISKHFNEHRDNLDYLKSLLKIFESDKKIIGSLILENEKKFVEHFKNYNMFCSEYYLLGYDAKFRTKKCLKIIDLNHKKFYLNYKIVLNCSYLCKKNIVNDKFQNIIHIPIKIKRHVFNAFSNTIFYLHNKDMYYKTLINKILGEIYSFNDIHDLLFLINFFEIKIDYKP